MPIVTLDALRAYLGIPAGESAENPRLWAALETASSEAERYANRRFMPYRAARQQAVNSEGELPLADDLLELAAVTDSAGAALTLADLTTAPDAAPYDRLLRTDGGLLDAGVYTVTGVWGWQDGRIGAGWQASGQVSGGALTAADGLLSVPDADATGMGGAALFEVGALLRLGDEFVWVVAVDATLNRLTLSRAAQGTTAAAHAAGTAILRWQPAALVSGWVLRRAAGLYRASDGLALPALDGDGLRGVRRLTVRG
jgi:hypothetical protein